MGASAHGPLAQRVRIVSGGGLIYELPRTPIRPPSRSSSLRPRHPPIRDHRARARSSSHLSPPARALPHFSLTPVDSGTLVAYSGGHWHTHHSTGRSHRRPPVVVTHSGLYPHRQPPADSSRTPDTVVIIAHAAGHCRKSRVSSHPVYFVSSIILLRLLHPKLNWLYRLCVKPCQCEKHIFFVRSSHPQDRSQPSNSSPTEKHNCTCKSDVPVSSHGCP